MNALAIGALIGVVGTLALYIWLARVDAKIQVSLSDYYFTRRPLSGKECAATIFASGMSFSTVLVALLTLGLIFGTSLLWASVAAYCVGWLSLTLVAPRIRERLPQDGTLHSFLGQAFGTAKVRTVASLATALGFVGTFATEIIAGTLLFRALGFNETLSVMLTSVLALVTVGYAALGGFSAVIHSDRWQAAILIPAVLILLVFAIISRSYSGVSGLIDKELASSWGMPTATAVGFVLINVAFPFVDMSAWQRIVAAKSDRAWRDGTKKAVVGFSVTWTLLIVTALIMAGTLPADEEPFLALVKMMGEALGPIAFFLGLIIFPAFIAAMFSTADTFLNAAANTIDLDLLAKREGDQAFNVNRGGDIGRARLRVFVLGIAGFSLCLILYVIGFGVVELIFAVYGAALALLPVTLTALLVPENYPLKNLSAWGLASIVAGFILAWVFGTTSVVCGGAGIGPTGVCNEIGGLIKLDPYASPLYALGASTLVFGVGLLFNLFPGNKPKGKY